MKKFIASDFLLPLALIWQVPRRRAIAARAGRRRRRRARLNVFFNLRLSRLVHAPVVAEPRCVAPRLSPSAPEVATKKQLRLLLCTTMLGFLYFYGIPSVLHAASALSSSSAFATLRAIAEHELDARAAVAVLEVAQQRAHHLTPSLRLLHR